jgi:hypothetical protein
VPEAVLVALPENRGVPAAASEGIRRSRGAWIALVNNDVVVEPDALAELLAAGDSAPEVGSVAAQMRFASDPGVINSAGIAVDRLGIARDRLLGEPVSASEERPVEVFGASGGAALHRRRMLDEVGGMDETYFFALEDVDLAFRLRLAGHLLAESLVLAAADTALRRALSFEALRLGRSLALSDLIAGHSHTSELTAGFDVGCEPIEPVPRGRREVDRSQGALDVAVDVAEPGEIPPDDADSLRMGQVQIFRDDIGVEDVDIRPGATRGRSISSRPPVVRLEI